MSGIKGTTHAYKGPRWGADEYERLACAMVPMIAKGKTKLQALIAAQRMLPKDRQRAPDRLYHNLRGPMETALAKALGMPEADRAAIVAVMVDTKAVADAKSAPKTESKPEPKQVDEQPLGMVNRGRHQQIRWNPTDWALVARRVAYFQRDLQDGRPLSRLIKVAQAIELPPAKNRLAHSVDTSMERNRDKLAHAYAEQDKLLADLPFDASRTEYIAPVVAPLEPELQKADAFDGVNIDGPRKSAPQAPEPVQAPTPAPIAREAISEPIRAFGETFARGMSDLIRSMTQTMMGELEARLGQMSERLMAKAIETMGQGVNAMVHSALEKELGPVAAPAAAAQAFMLPLGSSLPQSLQLDVVGLIGHQITEVKSQLNGHAASIRFIDADRLNAWTPRRRAIINTKFISHAVEGKCRAAGVKPIRVQGGADAIVNAIKELYAQEGITLAAH